jgi:serine/threonine protein kinase
MIGKTLSHCEFISQLGKGEMGEVYKAIDQKLRREVAIRVLPEEFHGRELFYHNGDAVMAAKVETDPVFKLIKPEVLFQEKYVTEIRGSMAWAIGRDGRFLMMKAVETTGMMPVAESPRKINVVLNWLEELKQKAPAD